MKSNGASFLFICSLLVLFGAARFTFSLSQTGISRLEEQSVMRSRQNHLMSAVKASLLHGKSKEAESQLTAAHSAGYIAFYSLQRDEGGPSLRGSAEAPYFGDSSRQSIEAGPYTAVTVANWSWALKAIEAGTKVALELTLLLATYLSVLSGKAYLRRKKPARAPGAMKILREAPEIRRVSVEVSVAAPTEIEAFECGLLRLQWRNSGIESGTVFPALAARAAALAKRYGGEVCESNGEEILFYFRDAADGNSALLAVSAARDLRSFLKVQCDTHDCFYSVTHGYVRLSRVEKQGGGRAAQLQGAPLLELAGLVPSAGQVVVTERVAKFAAPAAKFKPRDTQFLYTGHEPLTEVLLRTRGGQCNELDAYHTDEHLLEIFGSLREGWTTVAFLGAVGRLRCFSYQDFGPAAAGAFKNLLRAELDRENNSRVSALVTLVSHFFNRESLDQELYNLVLRALGSPDRRVKSNTVELFIRLYPREEIAELAPLRATKDNRLFANLLIKRALERFDEKVVSALYRRVQGGSVAHVASALFALGEIARHYNERDPAALRVQPSFHRLCDEIPYWTQHPNIMVRRQALCAAKKLADAAVEQRLRQVFATCHDEELLLLFDSIFGWKKPDGAARRIA